MRDAPPVHQLGVTGKHLTEREISRTAYLRRYAVPCHFLCRRRMQGGGVKLCGSRQRLGNGVRGEGFGACRVPEQGCRINARRRTDVLYGKSALRQRSGL